MRVFLDAKVLFSAAHSPSSSLTALWRLSGVKLVTSAYAVHEATRNLPVGQGPRLSVLLETVEIHSPALTLPALAGTAALREIDSLPEKDRPILAAAIGVRVDVLLTGDKQHFGPLFGTRIQGVEVLTPSAFLARLAQ